MVPFVLLMKATKLFGVAGVVAVALNAIAYRSFWKGNLLPFDSPIDDDEEILASFDIDKDVDDGGFFFALGTAPAHVEDKLQDAWLEFAAAVVPSITESPTAGLSLPLAKTLDVRSGKNGKHEGTHAKPSSGAVAGSGEETYNVAAWQNAFNPEERLRFWSDPDTELQLAKEANVTVFRMGVDWGRIVPVEPVDGIEKAVDWDALQRYRDIIEKVRAHGMRVMLTLFHHSMPSWAAKFGGWKNPKTLTYFVEFTKVVAEKHADLVDFWVTFNEPHVFALLTYWFGGWPGADSNSFLENVISLVPGNGIFGVVMAAMADAHLRAYDVIHEVSNKLSKRTKVGVAHHVSFVRPYGLFDVPIALFSNMLSRFSFLDETVKKLDYIGINYYGQEILHITGIKYVKEDEYSESGRALYPDGLFRVLTTFHNRYKKLGIPFIVTENGVSDSTDYIRRPYITEHLLAVHAARAEGVPVQGYCFWTTSDNWEWADGYGPKFGLVAVDRHHDLARTPRPSYHLFSEIAKTGKVTKKQRDEAWEDLQTVADEGMNRPFYRDIDKNGLMFSSGLDVPVEMPLAQRDWRFGHYELEGLQDPISRFIRFIFSGDFLGLKKEPKPRTAPPAERLPGKRVVVNPMLKLMTEQALQRLDG